MKEIVAHILDDAEQIRSIRLVRPPRIRLPLELATQKLLTPGRSRQQSVARSSECRVVQCGDLAFVGNGEPCPIRLGLSITAGANKTTVLECALSNDPDFPLRGYVRCEAYGPRDVEHRDHAIRAEKLETPTFRLAAV